MTDPAPPARGRGADLWEILGPITDQQARTLVRLFRLGPYAAPNPPTGDTMTKPRLTQAQHRELGSTLAGVRGELHRRGTQLANAYPRSGPEAEPMELLDAACDAVKRAQQALENLCFKEHPRTATTEDYFPQEEDEVAVVVLPRAR